MSTFLNLKGNNPTAEAKFRRALRKLKRFQTEKTGNISEAQKAAAALAEEFEKLEAENAEAAEKISANERRLLAIRAEMGEVVRRAGAEFEALLTKLEDVQDVAGE